MLKIQYIAQEDTLKETIESKIVALSRIESRQGKNAVNAALAVKLYDYRQIDGLSSQQRQIVNHFFQEIEVVRMLDHVVGALYFLHHYEIPYEAVRPEVIFLDTEGKYLLPDR